MSQIGASLILYGLAIVWDASLAAILVPLPASGALIGCLICRWRPGFDAVWWKLLPAAAFTNLAMLMALGELAVQWRCLLGGRNCLGPVLPIVLGIIAICLLLPACGLLWRAWRRRSV